MSTTVELQKANERYQRLRAAVEALADEGERDGRGNTADLAKRLRALLNEPHAHEWRRRQNVTSRGFEMPAYEACECGAARTSE